MSDPLITLASLRLGQRGKVLGLSAGERPRRRMLDLGLIPGTVVEALHQSPSGDPTAYRIRGAVIALRSEEASCVFLDAANGGREDQGWGSHAVQR
jgi:ferrous iron transport protein A